jgi:hypothetical protein
MTDMFTLGNISGLVTLLTLAAGIFWATTQRNQPVVSVASMLRDQKKDR